MRITLPATAVFLMLAGCGGGPIGSACLDTERGSQRPATCTCIQKTADSTLTGGDQRRAARLFADPDRAQEVRTSDTSADNAFWRRYNAFGNAAERRCG